MKHCNHVHWDNFSYNNRKIVRNVATKTVTKQKPKNKQINRNQFQRILISLFLISRTTFWPNHNNNEIKLLVVARHFKVMQSNELWNEMLKFVHFNEQISFLLLSPSSLYRRIRIKFIFFSSFIAIHSYTSCLFQFFLYY